MLATLFPLPIFVDIDGTSLQNGSVYYGVSGQNPETSPTTVYWDSAGTQPAAQPLRTQNGLIMRNGTPAPVYIQGDYSITVRNKNGVIVVYAASASAFDNSITLQSQLNDFSDLTTPAKGAGKSSFAPTLNYVTQTIGAAILDSLPSMLSFVTSQADRANIIAGTSVVDHTALFTAALAITRSVLLPEGRMNHTGLTLSNRGAGIYGKGARSVLVHTGAGTAITLSDPSATIFPGGAPTYVNDGQFRLDNFMLYTNGPIGIDASKTGSTGTTISRLYMKPFAYYAVRTNSTYQAGMTAISCDNNPWAATYSTYGVSVRDCQIAGYENMTILNEVVNLWEFDNVYTIDCLRYAKLAANPGANPGVGKIRFSNGYCESGIAAARGIVYGSGGGTSVVETNMTYELTNAASTQYARDFSAGGVWTGCAAHDCTYLIQNDGGGVNNRRITGTAPLDFIETNRQYLSTQYNTLSLDWAPGASTAKPRNLPSFARLGGFQLGLGTLYFGRSDTDAADSVITHDASSNLLVQGYNDVRVQTAANYAALTFTAAPAQGATNATLNANWTNPTGDYNIIFSTGDVRSVTLTNGAATATWATGLSAVATTAATAFGLFNGLGWKLDAGGKWWGPLVDNTYSLGAASNRPSQLYAGTATINTSDATEKQDIRGLLDAEKRVGVRLRGSVRAYRWKDAVATKGDGARIHVGWIAQEVIAAFQAEGLDPFAYGVCCHDKWGALPEVVDENGNVVQAAREAGELYGVRQNELVAFILGAL